ncbi:putative membrane protein [Bacteroidales bacterium Barb6XT]|nr:putative membrane protein [Bacteroidales bacterium Barb6XT]
MGRYKLINNVLGWITFLIAAAVYLMTMEPTASFWDCGEFISSAFKLEVGHPPGAPFFMLTANLFTQFVSDVTKVPVMINAMSALFSALTILFLFWSITHLARKIIVDNDVPASLSQTIVIMGCGLTGALAYTFSDTFWFSAVEGEVYAYSSLFTAIVFWLILKWEAVADRPHADRWIVLIAYLMGLSIGVHLLNLLCIPAIVLVYYYKKYPNPTMKGTLIALGVSFAVIALMMYGVVQGLVEVCGWFELLFVNGLGMPYNSGVFVYVLVLGGVLCWAVWETMRENIDNGRMKIAFILSVTLLGIPFIGSGYWLGILLIAALTVYLFKGKNIAVKALNTILISLMVIVVGYSSYALIMIRATADTPMNQNAPKDIFTLRTYLAREQYGSTPLIYGQTYAAEIKRETKNGVCAAITEEGDPTWSRVIKQNDSEKDKYYISHHSTEIKYVDELQTLFPRMFSSDGRHVEAYKEWAQIKGTPVKINRCGEIVTVMKPTFAENIRYFFAYQLNFMYWRYFMWNFSGRQNDIQGHGEVANGNWITGIKFVDEALVGPQDDMPFDIANNKAHNSYFMLPLLLGILGLLYQAYAGRKGIQGFWITFFLFFMTGIAIVLYLNQTPYQPRERDYAYAASFYAFCIWIGFGVAALAKGLHKYAKLPEVAAALAATIACLLVPARMASENWDDHDRSQRYFARDFGSNYLESCEPNAVIFTNGDNDTFPLWYAQEVEGIRTDVRVCNTSYLQTDWYIDQMKRDAYESAALPVSWNREDYIQGKRDFAYVIPRLNQPLDLLAALNFVRSNDPKNKRVPEYRQELDYIPSKTLIYKVDSAAAVSNGVVSPEDIPYMLKEMTINLDGKDALGKQELIVLDMLQTNNWKRPIYYAITVSSDQYVKLDPYFRQTGLAYQIVPMNVQNTTKAVDTQKMYDNLMNKFRWGGADNPKAYMDENVMRMLKNYRSVMFSRLASSLVYEGDTEKALNVLDRGMEVIPPATVPLDYSALSFSELYYQLGKPEKAEEIHTAIVEDAFRNLNWYFRLKPAQLSSVERELGHNLAVVQDVLRVSKRYNPDFAAKYEEEFDNYRMAYESSKSRD